MNSEVDRIWGVYRSKVKVRASAYNSMYRCRISALLKMNDIVGAEKAYEEWESKDVYYDSRLVNLLLTAYCKEGLMEKAEALVAQFFEIGRRPFASGYFTVRQAPKPVDLTEYMNTLASAYFKVHQASKAVDLTKYRNTLASGYFKVGQASKAVDLTKKALAYASSECIPDLTNVLLSLNYFTEQKNVEAAEEMVASLLRRRLPWVPPTRNAVEEMVASCFSWVTPTRDVYHGLLKTYVNVGKPVSDLLDRMKKDGMEADEETEKILAGEVH
uniref:Pentacotripeptide-repeat region of PRORP domain-containing protein n=1 Tax=Oryza punctata TaxID=4537 RepID=A0A0E0M946_ORYPU